MMPFATTKMALAGSSLRKRILKATCAMRTLLFSLSSGLASNSNQYH